MTKNEVNVATLLETHPHEHVLAWESYGELTLPSELECCGTSPSIKKGARKSKSSSQRVHLTIMPLIQNTVSVNQKLAELKVAQENLTMQTVTGLIENLLEGVSHLKGDVLMMGSGQEAGGKKSLH